MRSLVILSLIVRIYSTMATEVNLRVFGYQDNNSMITLCPRDKFMLVAECTVKGSSTLVWSLLPLLRGTVGINAFSDLGESEEEGVTFVLAKKSLAQTSSENSYISQVQVHTDGIRDSIDSDEDFFIRCEADNSTEYALITLNLAAGDGLNITSGSRTGKILSVSWTTNITSIFKTTVTAKNNMSGLESSIVVGEAIREASLIVAYPDPYNIIVTIFDQCQQNFSSEAFYIEGLPEYVSAPTVELPATIIPQNTPTTSSSSSVFLSNSPVLKQQCTTKENIGLIVWTAVLSLVVVALFVIITIAMSRKIWKLKIKMKDCIGKTSSLGKHMYASNVE